MAQNPRACADPRGSPATARMWLANWLVHAPSMVQWPELWTRGAISFASSPPSVSKSSRHKTPT